MIINPSKKIFEGVIYQYLSSIISAVFNFLISVYVIKKLSVDEFGIYNFMLSVVLLAQVVTSLGLPQILQRYLPEYREKKINYFQKRILSISLLVRFFAGFIFVSIFLMSNNWVITVFNLPIFARNLIFLLSLIILLNLESQLLGDSALVALFENRYWNFSKMTYSGFKFMLFFLFLSMGYGIKGIVLAWLIAEGILFLLFFVRSYTLIFSLPSEKEEIHALPVRRFFNFGGVLFLSQVALFFRDKAADIFILSYFLGVYAVGLYSFAYGIPLMLMNFSPGSLLRGVTTPFLVYRYTKSNNKEELSYFFQLLNKIIFFTMIPIFVILIIFADKVIMYIFHPDYLKVKSLFMLSIGFMLVQQFAYAYIPIIYTLEKTRIILVGSLTAIYNLLMDLILIPSLGIVGAILATGSAGVLLLIYYSFSFRKKDIVILSYPWNAFLKSCCNIAITALIIFPVKEMIHSSLSLLIVLFIAIFIYLVVSYFNKAFNDNDRQIINQASGKKIWIF
jgi:O-antigen/teichoic acid export membrane protein